MVATPWVVVHMQLVAAVEGKMGIDTGCWAVGHARIGLVAGTVSSQAVVQRQCIQQEQKVAAGTDYRSGTAVAECQKWGADPVSGSGY